MRVRIRRIRLSLKLPALVALAVFLTALTGSLLSISIGRRILRKTELEANVHSVQTYASAIGSYLYKARSVLEFTADLPQLTDFTPARLVDRALHGVPAGVDLPKRRIAARVLAHSKVFEYVMLLQADGTVYLLEPYHLQVKLSRHDLAFTAWYRKLMSTGQTIVSNLHISTATQRPTVVIATPVRGAAGQIIGIWAGALRLGEFSRIGNGGLKSEMHWRYGYVTDGRGLIIAHQGEPQYVEEQTDFSKVPPVSTALVGGRGTVQFINPIDGEEELGAYMPLPGLRWAVVYEVPTQVAFAPIKYLTRSIMLASTGLAILLVLVGSSAVRQIVKPLGQLTTAAAAIGAGDFSRRIEVRTGDEIERLADEFNGMATALANKEGQLRGYAEQLEQTVQDRTTALHQLEQANRELEAFSYSVSHDLRAPLVSMNGFSRILLEEHAPQLSDEARHYLQRVQDNARQMSHLIDDLLAFSRTSRQPLQKQPVAPADLARQALEALRTEQDGLCVEIAIDRLQTCEADPALLKQVFVNLISNALKFTPKREGARIQVGCQCEGNKQIYFVQDNGVGFDMRHVDKLFGVFQRLHRSEDYPGTGVGLAIVQRIIQRHGGSVWADAELNRGATFYFTL